MRSDPSVEKSPGRPCLSICIATYNRADFIGETLESIIPQVTDDVEIVIVDGASTDQTGIVVGKYAAACRQIRYVLLPIKGGFDHDYDQAVNFALGEYCWLFTDDDLLKPDAVASVLHEIAKGYSLIVVNAQVMNKDFSKFVCKRSMNIKKNELYDASEFERLFCRVILYMSFIGCVVIHRDLWLQRERRRYFGTEFIHVGVIFQAALPAPAFVIAEPKIVIRWGNAQWQPRSFEIWMVKWPKLLSSFTNISEYSRRPFQKSYSWYKLKIIIILRSNKEFTLKEYRKWLAVEDSALWWKTVALIIALVPCAFFKFVRSLKKKWFQS